MRTIKLLGFVVIIFAVHANAQDIPRIPMAAIDENSMKYRWHNKKVIQSILLDDAENPSAWKFQGKKGEISFTTERFRDGKQSLRLRAHTKGDGPAPGNRPWGSAGAVRIVEGEDWSNWNRISLWVYPDLPGFKIVNVGVIFHNQGKRKVPGPGGSGMDYVIVKNREWNQILSEIEYCDRDSVTGIEIQYRLQGNEADATETVQFDIDHIELQRVEPDKIEGWDVAPGRISFSHAGYPLGAPKTAISSHLTALEFNVINSETGNTVLSKPMRKVKTPLGEYQVMDFTEVRAPGSYFIQAGKIKTGVFPIDNDVWQNSIFKAVNFFYSMRCGYPVPGIHGVCHNDWIATQGDKQLIINGGWHDAGDLSQGLINTSDATYSMFSLAERLLSVREDTELSSRLIEEATWGLDCLAKTSFHNGKRVQWAVLDFWTDGVIGTTDDPHTGSGNSPYEVFAAASAEAIAYRVLKEADPSRAKRSLDLAREDWEYAMQNLAQSTDQQIPELANAINASLELFKTTGEQKYADQAIAIAPLIVNSQEHNFIPGTTITGFFYDNPVKGQKLQTDWQGTRDHCPIIALSRLVEYFPLHGDWMKWYSALGLYSEYYLKNTAKYTEPYGMLPDGISNVVVGRKISESYYLRNFPTREGFGNLHLVLSLAKALAVAAQTRGDLESFQLAEKQIQWVLGRNPFSQSFMYGEGYDYHDLYNISGHVVGALPVGLPTHGKSDTPYWPPNSWFAPMEVWVLPVLRYINLMREVVGPAIVEGRAKTSVTLKNEVTGALTTVKPEVSGNFRAVLPQGKYVLSADGFEQNITLLPGTSHKFDPSLNFVVTSTTGKDSQVTIEIIVKGTGVHDFSIRTNNLTLTANEKSIDIKPGLKEKLVWNGKVENVNSPWFAVVVPDSDLTKRKETNGPGWLK